VAILFFTSVIQFLEKSAIHRPFHTWMYMSWVTMTTVGYGDVSPKTILGRIADMAFILFAIITIPKMTNELFEKMSLQSVYARASYSPKGPFSKHVVICGDVSSISLEGFFEELFHEDHENSELNAVLLLPTPPSIEILFLMRDPRFVLNITYLEGSALLFKDLKRAKVEQADAVFIMTNKFCSNPDEEDSCCILQNLSVKRYMQCYEQEQNQGFYCIFRFSK
jgi:hypothetical protein